MKKVETVTILGIENKITTRCCDKCKKKLTANEISYIEDDLASGYINENEEYCLECDHLDFMSMSYQDRVNRYSSKKTVEVKTVKVKKQKNFSHSVSLETRYKQRMIRQNGGIRK